MFPQQTSIADIHLKSVQNIKQKTRRGFNVDKLLIKLYPEIFKLLKGQEIKPELFFRSEKEAEGEKKKITRQYLEWENIYIPYDKGPYSTKNQITFQFILQGKKEAAYTTPFFKQTFVRNNESLFDNANSRCGDINISISWKQNFEEGNQTPIQKPNRFSKQKYPSQSQQQPSIFQTICGFLSCSKQTEEQKNRKALKIKKTVMYDLKDFVTEEVSQWNSKQYPLQNLIEFHANKSILG